MRPDGFGRYLLRGGEILFHLELDRGTEPGRRVGDKLRRYPPALANDEKRELASALGDEFEIRWFEGWTQRWACARLYGLATDIRLRIPETFHIHKRVIDWQTARSTSGIPAGAVGLGGMPTAPMPAMCAMSASRYAPASRAISPMR